MSLDEKSGKVKCGTLRKIKQKQKQKKACVMDAFFFNGSHDIDFTVFFSVSSWWQLHMAITHKVS